MKKDQPQAPTPPRDPALDALKEQSRQDNIKAISQSLDQETNSLLVRYGARVALSGSNIGSPLRLGG